MRNSNPEKALSAFLLTWCTRYSRPLGRMLIYRKQSQQSKVLTSHERKRIALALSEKLMQLNCPALALNVLTDHVHCVVVCEAEKVSELVRQLKGYSAYCYNRQLKLSVAGMGRQSRLWSKGTSCTLLEEEAHLINSIEYVENNHFKHGLSGEASSGFDLVLQNRMTTIEQAFTTEKHLLPGVCRDPAVVYYLAI